jgi:hypothetical protein
VYLRPTFPRGTSARSVARSATRTFAGVSIVASNRGRAVWMARRVFAILARPDAWCVVRVAPGAVNASKRLIVTASRKSNIHIYGFDFSEAREGGGLTEGGRV